MDYIEIGSAPYDEDCAQLGSDDYPERSRRECAAFNRQLVRIFGEPPEGARLSIRSSQHDYGTYREVACYFVENNERAIDYAFKLEAESPANWDAEALAELEMFAKISA